MSAAIGVFGIVFHLHHFGLPLGIVGDDYLDWVDDGHAACGHFVEVVAHGVLEERDGVESLIFGIADGVDKVAYGARSEAASAQTRDGRHAGVVPSGHESLP